MTDQTHILVAAREPEWRKFVAQVLAEAGYRVRLGSNTPAALQEIARNDFDLIIVDALLPDLLKILATVCRDSFARRNCSAVRLQGDYGVSLWRFGLYEQNF